MLSAKVLATSILTCSYVEKLNYWKTKDEDTWQNEKSASRGFLITEGKSDCAMLEVIIVLLWLVSLLQQSSSQIGVVYATVCTCCC